MLLFDKPFCRIYYYEDLQTVHLDWGKHYLREEFIEACDFSLKVLIEKKAKKMIADNSIVTVVSLENQNWLTKNWFPRALEHGFRYSAVIISNDAFVNHAVKRIERNINSEIFVIQYFNSVQNAKEWLKSLE